MSAWPARPTKSIGRVRDRLARTWGAVWARDVFHELLSGLEAIREHRAGRLALRTDQVKPTVLPQLKPESVRQTREALHMSRQAFAFNLRVKLRTLERWEQGRSRPNRQADALIWLLRKYPDTLKRLESLSASA